MSNSCGRSVPSRPGRCGWSLARSRAPVGVWPLLYDKIRLAIPCGEEHEQACGQEHHERVEVELRRALRVHEFRVQIREERNEEMPERNGHQPEAHDDALHRGRRLRECKLQSR